MCVFEGTATAYSMDSTANTSSGFRIVTPQDDKGTPLLCRTRTECIDGVLPVTKGGTGITNIMGSKLIASCADGISLEEIEVPVDYLSGLTGNIQSLLNAKADSIRTFEVPVSNDSNAWTTVTDSDSNQYKTRSIPVTGILATDNPITGLQVTSTTKTGIESEEFAFSCVDFVETFDESITLYCYGDIPTAAFTMSLTCI